jgi:hypothetical protein
MVNNLTTDANGTCTITNVKKGSLTVTVSKEGYVDASKTINVTSDTTVNFTLEEEQPQITSRLVNFTVNDGTTAIGSATVVIDNDTENAKTTGGAGGCTATLTDGEHTIKVSKEGYVTKTETITVSEDNSSFTISLTSE